MKWKESLNRVLSTSATVGIESQVAVTPLEILSFRRWKRHFAIFIGALAAVILFTRLFPIDRLVAQTPVTRNNAIIFVADGLRAGSVNATDTPTLYGIAQRGVSFSNSHSLFPTFTTANGAAIATGHYLGDNGDFSNTIYTGFPVPSASNSVTPFIESDAVLADLNAYFGGNYLNEETLLAAARAAGFSTAAVGKLGPVLIQDVTQGSRVAGTIPPPTTIVIDDRTGQTGGVPLNAEISAALTSAGLATTAPGRGDNGTSGNNTTAGTKVANITQQQYFTNTVTNAILPLFKRRGKRFVIVYWSRDPDGSQHNQGDSLNTLTPGINGPTSKAAIKNADKNLAQIIAALQSQGLYNTTDIFVTADHGFSTISKQSATSYSASLSYSGVNPGFLPPGFVAMDLARGLGLPLYDPDQSNKLVTPGSGTIPRPLNGNGLIGTNPNSPNAVVAANGGSDLIYLPGSNIAFAQQVVNVLLQQDYVSGLFVSDSLGSFPGTLPLSAINLQGSAITPVPTIAVNFRSYTAPGCTTSTPLACTVEVADTGLQQGQGMHGTFSRADTFNYMAVAGPDFKQAYADLAPVSNADVAVTLAQVLGLKPPVPTNRGTLVGRVITEALARGPASVSSSSQSVASQPAANGLQTVLKYQTVGSTRYFDAAGFSGRTVGL